MFLLGVETPQPFISIAPDPTKNVLITKYQNSRDFKIFFIPLSISTTATIFCLNFYLCTHNKSSAPIGRELKQLVGRRHFNRNKRVNSFVSNRWIDQFLSFFPKFLLSALYRSNTFEIRPKFPNYIYNPYSEVYFQKPETMTSRAACPWVTLPGEIHGSSCVESTIFNGLEAA